MDLDGYKKLFVGSKDPMYLNHAQIYIRRLMETNYPILPKTAHINRGEYIHRMAQRTACMELVNAIQNAPPWKDYREIFAEMEWPFMRRAGQRCIDGSYSGPYGNKRGEADAWIVEMWRAYHDIFRMMPGTIPDTTQWRMHENLMGQILNKTAKFRRKL